MEQERDTLFLEEKAQSWVIEVEAELKSVKELLGVVATECKTKPEEDDTIFCGLADAGTQLGNAWDGVVTGFGSLIDGFKNIMGSITSSVGNTLISIGEFLSGGK